MDPFIVAFAAAIGAAAGISLALKYRQRARLADALAIELRSQVTAERMAARRDPATGMLNRQGFFDLGRSVLSDPGSQPLVVVLIGIDDVDFDSDDLGPADFTSDSLNGDETAVRRMRAADDEVRLALGRRLTEYTAGHLVARLGADEYGALLTSSTQPDGSRYPDAGELLRVLAEPILVNGLLVRVAASIGVTHVDGTGDLHKAVSRAEAVMRLSARARSRAYHPSIVPADAGELAGGVPVGPAYCRSRVPIPRRRR